MKICIIGAGNAGCAHAFKFTEFGHEVRLVKTSHSLHDDYFNHIVKDSTIHAIDHTLNSRESYQKISMITRDMEKGINGADIVLVMTQSLQHDELAPRVAPLLIEGQMVMLIPGNMGSFIFKKIAPKGVIIGEGESTPFDARIEDDFKVHILFRNVRNAVSFIPASSSAIGIEKMKNLYETYGYLRKNVIESGLHNPNLIVHTVGAIMSAARIEKMNGDFWMYRESFSPAVWNLVEQLDEEKNAVLEAFGCERLDYLDACKFRNENDLSMDSLKVFQSYAANGGPKGPQTLNTRFIYEDVPNGLCLLSALASHIGLDTPVCNALITIGCSLMKTDYWKVARTPKKLGLSEMSKKQIIDYIS